MDNVDTIEPVKIKGHSMPKNVAQNEKIAARNAAIKEMHANGFRQVEIAKKFGLKQARVSQIVRNPNADRYYV